MRFLLWLLQCKLEESQLQASVASLSEGPPRNGVEELVQETYNWFWSLDASWSEVMESGWPLFSLMAAVAGRIRDAKRDPCVPTERLQLYIDSFDNAIYVPTSVHVATLVDAASCPDAVSSALISLADIHRTTTLANENRYYQFTATQLHDQPAEDDTQQLLAQAESLLRRHRGWDLLTSPWPIWRLLDRLSARDAVKVSAGGSNSFWMHVFPHRVRSDGLISNRIRGTSEAYCLQLFQDEVIRLAASTERPLRLVEAGPHIGDCMLWASATFRERVRGLAVEPVAQVVSLFRRSIVHNGFNIDLHHAFAGAESRPPAPGGSVPWLSLDSLLAEDVDILKIHTNGGERGILDGARNLFAKHMVRVVIVHSAEPDQLWKSTEFLLERGYSVRTDGQELSTMDETWLKEAVQSRGGLQIHALRPG